MILTVRYKQNGVAYANPFWVKFVRMDRYNGDLFILR